MQLQTSVGHLNLELHCDLAPRTCENFIALADSGYYKDTVFHRSIKNFMIQVRVKQRQTRRPCLLLRFSKIQYL